jgi:hypothetical protein
MNKKRRLFLDLMQSIKFEITSSDHHGVMFSIRTPQSGIH